MVYETLFIIGLIGLLAQSFLRFGHGGHGSSAHAGHGHAGHSASGHSHAGHSDSHHATDARNEALWALLSPLALFSLALGGGATGLLVHSLLSAIWTAIAAFFGALTFYLALVRPIWNVLMRFASEPSKALAGAVAQTAEVVSRFDAQGNGVVRLTLDGQSVRVLAHLEPDIMALHEAIHPGEKLLVTRVDSHANACTVTRL